MSSNHLYHMLGARTVLVFLRSVNPPHPRQRLVGCTHSCLPPPGPAAAVLIAMEAPGALADRWGGKQGWAQTEEGRAKDREVKKRLRKQAKKSSKKVGTAVADVPTDCAADAPTDFAADAQRPTPDALQLNSTPWPPPLTTDAPAERKASKEGGVQALDQNEHCPGRTQRDLRERSDDPR